MTKNGCTEDADYVITAYLVSLDKEQYYLLPKAQYTSEIHL